MKIQTLFDSRKKDEITNSSTKSRKLQKIAPQKCKHKKCSDQRSSDTSKGVNAFLEHREPMFLVMVGNLLWENLIIFHLTLFGLTADHSVRSYFTIPLTIDIYPFTFFFLLGGEGGKQQQVGQCNSRHATWTFEPAFGTLNERPMGGAFQNEPKENTSESESHDKRLYLKKTAPDFPSTPYMKISMKNCVFFEGIFSFKTSNTPTLNQPSVVVARNSRSPSVSE